MCVDHLSDREVEALSDFVRHVCAEVLAGDHVPCGAKRLLQLRFDQLGTLLPVQIITPAIRGETRRKQTVAQCHTKQNESALDHLEKSTVVGLIISIDVPLAECFGPAPSVCTKSAAPRLQPRLRLAHLDLLSHASLAASVATSLASSPMSLKCTTTSGTPSRSTDFLFMANEWVRRRALQGVSRQWAVGGPLCCSRQSYACKTDAVTTNVYVRERCR